MIEDARARQRHQRRIGAWILLVAAAAVTAALLVGGGGRGAVDRRSAVAKDSVPPGRSVGLRLGRGPTTSTFRITAPASRAYDVTVLAPAAAAAVVNVRLGVTGAWSLDVPGGQGCEIMAGEVSCVLQFAAGGNPGGVWLGTVAKTSIPAARIHISFAFNARAGDYPG